MLSQAGAQVQGAGTRAFCAPPLAMRASADLCRTFTSFSTPFRTPRNAIAS